MPVRLRLRVKSVQNEAGGRVWYAAQVTEDDREVSRSPEGTEADAEAYLNNFKRYGAWLKS